MKFSDFALSPAILKALAKCGFEAPTPVQEQAIPPQLEGRDVLGLAQTGTGKTAAFALPLIERLGGRPGRQPRQPRALILAPTRELAAQIDDELRRFGSGLSLRTVLVLGGMSRANQTRAIAQGVDVVVATPGRLIDLMDDNRISLAGVETLVLDEADRMLDLGFVRDIRKVAAATPKNRKTALFSATMPKEIEALAAELLNDPVRIEIAPQGTTVQVIEQRVEHVSAGSKRGALAKLLADPEMARVIVFARTKRGCDRVAKNLETDGYPAEAIHGDKAQNARQRALDAFKRGRARVLVATDIAARGIDVDNVTHVVNFDLPDEPENYTHRIGRTGRNGKTGVAITLCDETETDKLRAVEKLIRRAFLADGSLGDQPPAPQRPAQNPPGTGRRRSRNRRGGGARQAA
ncbi:DEAD/DEAH box helicase [Rubrimonas cliftonensis]|uniref:DEAD-box ATP-dependent RNA helicase RhpA n=1 Tax=Rubrimonas cliftonensis TaxID=89524 RepID=A0A1H3VMZ7_9RHOB|nr:DEAD/DEAH box helicase [Rubrimonas cliftonensis]SDZ76183.1 ATP-dependent RNA helicase RhlE [Rubrimonas cliftonensis]